MTTFPKRFNSSSGQKFFAETLEYDSTTDMGTYNFVEIVIGMPGQAKELLLFRATMARGDVQNLLDAIGELQTINVGGLSGFDEPSISTFHRTVERRILEGKLEKTIAESKKTIADATQVPGPIIASNGEETIVLDAKWKDEVEGFLADDPADYELLEPTESVPDGPQPARKRRPGSWGQKKAGRPSDRSTAITTGANTGVPGLKYGDAGSDSVGSYVVGQPYFGYPMKIYGNGEHWLCGPNEEQVLVSSRYPAGDMAPGQKDELIKRWNKIVALQAANAGAKRAVQQQPPAVPFPIGGVTTAPRQAGKAAVKAPRPGSARPTRVINGGLPDVEVTQKKTKDDDIPVIIKGQSYGWVPKDTQLLAGSRLIPGELSYYEGRTAEHAQEEITAIDAQIKKRMKIDRDTRKILKDLDTDSEEYEALEDQIEENNTQMQVMHTRGQELKRLIEKRKWYETLGKVAGPGVVFDNAQPFVPMTLDKNVYVSREEIEGPSSALQKAAKKGRVFIEEYQQNIKIELDDDKHSRKILDRMNRQVDEMRRNGYTRNRDIY